jgi:tripeptide aminopeptidase
MGIPPPFSAPAGFPDDPLFQEPHMSDSTPATRFAPDPTTRARLLDRFLKYVKIHTQSCEESTARPSSSCQFDLLRLLESQVREMGLSEIHLDEAGYLYAAIPSNLPGDRKAPALGLIAHVDTYPAVSGKDVKPQVIERYAGEVLVLPGDPSVVLRPEDQPNLNQCIGHTLVTSDGTTLLGADDKAGCAIIMEAARWLLEHPKVEHGPIRLAFSTDEEVGRGMDAFDVARFGANVAYTLDGSDIGEIEDETFCGDSCIVTFRGTDCHPGWGKGKLKSAIRAAAHFITLVPEDFLPETTDGRQPYAHPFMISGDVSKVTLTCILRAFTVPELEERGRSLHEAARETRRAFPEVPVEVEITESYRNMKVMLDKVPEVMDLAEEAVRLAGLEPKRHSIRGGTDGARLSFMGVPTPNIFAGGQSFHSLKEWVSLEWMEKSLETTLHLVDLWSRREK